MASATAYNYFASKEHLVTDVFWRRLRSLPEPDVDRSRHSSTRVSDALADVVLLVADEPELATACTAAMLATDPDVKDLRERIGGAIHQRLARALGDGADPAALGALELAATGALVAAGMGHLAYPELPARLHEVAELVLDGRS